MELSQNRRLKGRKTASEGSLEMESYITGTGKDFQDFAKTTTNSGEYEDNKTHYDNALVKKSHQRVLLDIGRTELAALREKCLMLFLFEELVFCLVVLYVMNMVFRNIYHMPLSLSLPPPLYIYTHIRFTHKKLTYRIAYIMMELPTCNNTKQGSIRLL